MSRPLEKRAALHTSRIAEAAPERRRGYLGVALVVSGMVLTLVWIGVILWLFAKLVAALI